MLKLDLVVPCAGGDQDVGGGHRDIGGTRASCEIKGSTPNRDVPNRRPTRTTLPRIPCFCSKPFEAQRRSRFAFSTRGFTRHCSAADTAIAAAPSLNHPAEPVLSSRRARAP